MAKKIVYVAYGQRLIRKSRISPKNSETVDVSSRNIIQKIARKISAETRKEL